MKVKYIGTGYILGIPARDLTEQEWNGLTPQQQEAVQVSGLYEVKEKEKTRAKESPVGE